jgi:hypothetical protein
MTPPGFEHTQHSKQSAPVHDPGVNKSVNIDPDLDALTRAWPDLPGPVRAGILAMVKAAKP